MYIIIFFVWVRVFNICILKFNMLVTFDKKTKTTFKHIFNTAQPKGYGFYFSLLSHMFSSLPIQKPILRVFFFRRDSELEKKNRQPNLISTGNYGKKQKQFRIFHDFFHHGFFFPAKSRGKKKTVKLSPSFLFFWTIDSFVCDNLEK